MPSPVGEGEWVEEPQRELSFNGSPLLCLEDTEINIGVDWVEPSLRP